MTLLERSDAIRLIVPIRATASTTAFPLAENRSVNAVWTYEEPYPAVAAIAGHVAFYPDRVDAIEEQSEAEQNGANR